MEVLYFCFGVSHQDLLSNESVAEDCGVGTLIVFQMNTCEYSCDNAYIHVLQKYQSFAKYVHSQRVNVLHQHPCDLTGCADLAKNCGNRIHFWLALSSTRHFLKWSEFVSEKKRAVRTLWVHAVKWSDSLRLC